MTSRVPLGWLLLALALVGTGCVEAPVLREPARRDRIFEKSFDDVWQAVIANLALSGRMIGTTDKSAGLVTYRRLLSPSEVRAFTTTPVGGVFSSGLPRGEGYVNVLVRRDGERIRVHVNGSIMAQFFAASGQPLGAPQALGSNGKMEGELLDQLAVDLGEQEFKFLRERSATPPRAPTGGDGRRPAP